MECSKAPNPNTERNLQGKRRQAGRNKDYLLKVPRSKDAIALGLRNPVDILTSGMA